MKNTSNPIKIKSPFKLPSSLRREMVKLDQMKIPETFLSNTYYSSEEKIASIESTVMPLRLAGFSPEDLSLLPKTARTNLNSKDIIPRCTSLNSILSDSVVNYPIPDSTDRTISVQNSTIQDHFSLKKSYKLYAQRRNTDQIIETPRDSLKERIEAKFLKKKPKSNDVGGQEFNDTAFPIKRHFSTHRMIQSESSESKLQEISSGRISGYTTKYGTFARIEQDYDRLAQKYKLNPISCSNSESSLEKLSSNRYKKNLKSTAEGFSQKSFTKRLGIEKKDNNFQPQINSLRNLKASFSWYLHEIDNRPAMRIDQLDRKTFKTFLERSELNTLIDKLKGKAELEKEERRIISKLDSLNNDMKRAKNRAYNKFFEIPYDETLRNIEKIRENELKKYLKDFYRSRGNKFNEFTIAQEEKEGQESLYEEEKVLNSIQRGKKFTFKEFEDLMMKQLNDEEEEKRTKRNSLFPGVLKINEKKKPPEPAKIFTKRGSFLFRDRNKQKMNQLNIVDEKEEKKKRVKAKLIDFVKNLGRLGLTIQQFMIASPLSKAPFTHLKSKEFLAAVKAGKDAVANLMLKENQYLVQDYDYTHQTPLHWAAKRGYYDLARLLLRNGADPNALDLTLRTPLYYACRENQVETVKLLLLNKAKPWSSRNCDYNDPSISDKVMSYLKKARHINIGLSLSRKDTKKRIWIEESKIFEQELNSDKEEKENQEK